MKRLSTLALAAPLAGLLAACASSPASHFYALTAVAPEATPEAAAAETAVAGAAAAPKPRASAAQPGSPSQHLIRVAAVHIPSALDREEIVRSGAANELEISGLNRWGAPLDEMVQRVLTEDLLERLPAGEVVLPSSPAPAATDRIVVDILQFQSDTAGAVVFEGSWSLLPPGASAPSLIRNIHYNETAGPSNYADQAEAMSRMLGHLADDITSNLPRD